MVPPSNDLAAAGAAPLVAAHSGRQPSRSSHSSIPNRVPENAGALAFKARWPDSFLRLRGDLEGGDSVILAVYALHFTLGD